jgi:hypothetical protein
MKKAVWYVVDCFIYHFCGLMGSVYTLINAPAYRASNAEFVVYNL